MKAQPPSPLETLIRQLGSLPGLGSRSARRIALHLLQKKDDKMKPLAFALQDAAERVRTCDACGNLDMTNPCLLCTDQSRDQAQICIVAQVSDLWAIERTGAYNGLYFVLGGVLSALDGIGPEDLGLERLERRVRQGNVREVILALSATVNGQATGHFIADRLNVDTAHGSLKISRLAHGVPIGGELDYLDEGTITTALKKRTA